MVEIENNYKINVKKFGYVNWLGFYTLYKKEILRFIKVFSAPRKFESNLFSEV